MSDEEVKGGVETTNPPAEITSLDDDVARPTSTEYEVMEGGNLRQVPTDNNLRRSHAVQQAQVATQEQANSVDSAEAEFKPEADDEE